MPFSLFDTHCHYNLPPLADNWQQHWQQAQEKGVKKTVIVGTTLQTTRLAIEQAAADPNLFASAGMHPHTFTLGAEEQTQEAVTQALAEIPKLATAISKKTVAIGEIGLDYFRLPKNKQQRQAIRQHQQHGLLRQLQLAQDHTLPVLLHVRDRLLPESPTPGNAYWDTLAILEEAKNSFAFNQPFILHCVSGPKAYLKQALEKGAFIGVAANVTYKNADAIRELVQYAPQERLLLETDAPYLPPQAHRGQLCQPWMIAETAAFLHQELKLNPSQLFQNALDFFALS